VRGGPRPQETGFFARWWDEQPDDRRNLTRGLVASGQLEFINGAWCMHDEASPFYTEMIDQTTRGHQFLKKNFGDSAIPRGTWQIDPFGHSNTEAWLLGSEAGFESLFWGRTDYQDMAFRTSAAGKAKNMWPEWVWQGSQSLGKSAELLAGQLTVHGYGAPISWNDEGGAIQDNPSRHDYNADEVVTKFIASAVAMAENQNVGRLSHQLWPCGSDFQYQNADHWFHNLDKIIHYVNYNASKGGPVRAFYSTPSHYTDSKHAATTKQKATWELRSDDVFPLGDNGHAYWTGYFTSRPSLKRQVRLATNFLGAARQMEVLSGVTAAEVDTPTVRPSPPVGASWTDSLEGTIGVATHHDGMSGTEKQAVADDYSQRISESHFEVEAGVAKSLQKIAGISGEVGHCNCNTAGNCLNMSVCGYTTGVDSFTVIAWNPLGQNTTSWLRLPVSGASWTVTNLATKQVVPSQATVIDNRTKTLPLLYLRAWPHPDPEAVATHENKATHLVNFAAALPPVGYTSFSVKKAAATAAAAVQPANHATPPWVSNGFYNITLNHAAGLIDTITNLKSGVSQKINITFGYYEASEGGCTKEPHGAKDQCSSQASGAYMFRPAQQYTHSCDNTTQPTLEVTQGPLITEIKTVFADWATHVIRLQKDSQYISVEWTAGPIPREAYPGAKPPAPKPGPGGCVGWRQTSGCNAHGTLEPENNKPCSAKISQSGESGFCLCANDTKIYGSQCGAPSGDAGDTCAEICNKPYQPDPHKGFSGKEIVLKFNSDIDSAGAWYADANGREMVKRRRNARGPSYPPYQVLACCSVACCSVVC
jgi:alpha-mannosidase